MLHRMNFVIVTTYLIYRIYSRPSMARTLMLVYRGLFKLIFESLRIFSDSSGKQILREIFLFYYEIVCCVYSLESPHRGDSNEYTQHTITLLKIENISINYRHLLPDLAPWLYLICSNYPSLEQISMVPKMFESLKFGCIWIPYHSWSPP